MYSWSFVRGIEEEIHEDSTGNRKEFEDNPPEIQGQFVGNFKRNRVDSKEIWNEIWWGLDWNSRGFKNSWNSSHMFWKSIENVVKRNQTVFEDNSNEFEGNSKWIRKQLKEDSKRIRIKFESCLEIIEESRRIWMWFKGNSKSDSNETRTDLKRNSKRIWKEVWLRFELHLCGFRKQF